MATYSTPMDEIAPDSTSRFGGKACSLAALTGTGVLIPRFVGLGVEAYQKFVRVNGLDQAIADILARRPLEVMRWEEIWDLALAVRNLFLRARSDIFLDSLTVELMDRFPDHTLLAVRSSAPGEDAGATSFAGLHESHVGLQGAEAVKDAVIQVWSSLWSDRALLYRRELGLAPGTSAMAVLVQECIQGECSGVVFCSDPTDETRTVIEAVAGMNEALVDGSLPPARWLLDRATGRVLEVQPGQWDIQRDRLPDTGEIRRVWELARHCEAHFGQAQDVEWTICGYDLYCLQSRPITTGNVDAAPSWQAEDRRPWYLSLHRSLENLRSLQREVELELLPELDRESEILAGVGLASLDDPALGGEIGRRQDAMRRWRDIYWAKFIPLAHGVRLFGMVYNDALRPEDPFAFIDLLKGTKLEALQRNNALEEMATMVRDDPELMRALLQGNETADQRFQELFSAFLGRHGSLLCSTAWCTDGERGLVNLVLEMASRPEKIAAVPSEDDQHHLTRRFLQAFPKKRRDFALQVLELGRAAYRIRDNDNLALGRLQGELLRAVEEGQRRLASRRALPELQKILDSVPEDYLDVASPTGRSGSTASSEALSTMDNILYGQPAGPGLAQGAARVVHQPNDLFAFHSGEILVCEAMDPGMSFVVPLAAAIVEVRGGMLVHGAIIAREYGLPCVTGVTGALPRIRTGDMLLVDGYKGKVMIQSASRTPVS